MQHELKIWPQYFRAICDGTKTFEYRMNDRGFHKGDTLKLREYDIEIEKYTGSFIVVEVVYITNGNDIGVPPGFCIMGISKIEGKNEKQDIPCLKCGLMGRNCWPCLPFVAEKGCILSKTIKLLDIPFKFYAK